MKSFKDTEGREWLVSINVGTVKRVRDLCKVDLLDTLGGDVLQRLVADPVLLGDVLYVVVKPQADERNIIDEQFGSALGGDAVEHATTALLEELTDFFPPTKRPVLQNALRKLRELEQKQADHASKVINSGKLEKLVEMEFEKFDRQLDESISGSSSTNLPGSSG